MGRTTMPGYVCERCGHTWIPRKETEGRVPTVCPNARCKSPYWDTPRTRKQNK